MSNMQLVKDFVAAWNKNDMDLVCSFLHDEIFYHNMPMEPITSVADCEAFFKGMQAEEVDWRVLNIAENGDVVLTERVDGFVIAGKRIDVPVMGTFKIRDGKILEWRDYFDLQQFTSQMPQSAAQG